LAKHLTEKDISKILGVLDGWEGKLTWDGLCESVAALVGKKPTRQSLSSHKKVKLAFVNKKKRHRENVEEIKTPQSLVLAAQRIKRLEEINARLKNENDRLFEKFVIWQYNAYRNGLSEEKLNAALPEIDRKA
jgi:hypothetical protein